MTNKPENTGGKQRGRWPKGRSGNPTGKPKGARHRATLAAEALLDGEAEALTRKAIELALGGDGTALRLCIDRILPRRKSRPVAITMPPIKTPGDIVAALGAMVNAIAAGDLTPDEGVALASLLETNRRAIETAELELRIGALERATKK